MSILLSEIFKNNSLCFIDDEDNGKEISAINFEFINFPNEKKNVVFLYLDNSFLSIKILFSFFKTDHVITLLSPDLNENFKLELESIYKPLYIYDKNRLNILNYSHDKIIFFRRNNELLIDIHPSIKILLSTSGTTGSPKFVKLSEKNLLSNAISIASYLPITITDITPLNLPIYYSYGLSVLTSNAIIGGRIVCSNTDILNKDFWNKFQSYGYTSISGVPFVYEMLDRIGFTKKKYPSLKYLTQAGGKLQDSLVKKYCDYSLINNISFYVMYGQTEATARIAFLPPSQLINKIGSIGIPIPNGQLRIDEFNNELCYSGPNVFGGYVNSLKDLVQYEQIDELRSGDLAVVDSDGFYYITGRLKRFVKIFGSRINLDELESIITNKSEKSIKCTGYKDLYILLFTNEDNVDFKELINFISLKLKLHFSVFKSIQLEDYPLTSNGKLDYKKVIRIYESK